MELNARRVRKRLRTGGRRPALVVWLAHRMVVIAASLVHSVIPARFGWVCPAGVAAGGIPAGTAPCEPY